MNKKLVIFGPWIGEFTYEISWWIPEIRELRNTKYKDFKSIAVSSKGRKILYSDFIDEFIYYPNNLGKHSPNYLFHQFSNKFSSSQKSNHSR